MSGYILCQTKKAQRPYFIENISMNIYSIEELCYYLYHNLYLADHTVFNEELCNWLRDELELVHLAAKLKQNLERNVSVEEMIYPVFKEINYLTYEEMKGFNSRIVTYGKEKAAVRQKRKGDALTENGMYVNAIRVYQKLLEREDLSEQRKGFAASVRYNLGCAYSYLFQMEKAQECFLEAYREAHSKDALKAYIIAYSSVHDKTDYDKVMEELEVDEELKKNAWQVFEKLNLSPSEALRLFLRYVAENEKLPFSEVSVVVSDNDEDEDILNIVRERLKNPARRIRVNIDDL